MTFRLLVRVAISSLLIKRQLTITPHLLLANGVCCCLEIAGFYDPITLCFDNSKQMNNNQYQSYYNGPAGHHTNHPFRA
jgi:hypothetical protein